MAPSRVCAALALATASVQSIEINADAQNRANPVRKVVTMLQKMTKKVEAEGEKEADLFSKYMCYCKNAGGTLQASIAGNNAKVPELQATIEKTEAEKTQLDADLVKARSDREAAKSAIATATSIREKEAATFASYKADAEANIGALAKATAAIEKGTGGSFLQTSAAQVVKNLMENFDSSKLGDVDRQDVLAFLSNGQSYAASGEILGILKQLHEEMSKDLAATAATEADAIKSFDELMSAKTKEIDALTKAIEEKTIRTGEVAVQIVQYKNELSDSEASLIEDQKFLQDMEKNCATKEAEYEVVKQTRQEELTALAETVKILNDDDALELFKKTLPGASASFVQVRTSEMALRERALSALRVDKPGAKALNFIMLALRGKKIGFEKVIKMVDSMVVTLKKEQADDDNKQEYCNVQLDHLDDKKKGLVRDVADGEKAIADAEETLATLSSDIKALVDGIKALDKEVKNAVEQRQEENSDYSSLLASDTAAKELLEFAKNRLNKFYNPALYVPPPKRELSEEDRIAVNMGGTAPPTPAPGGIAGTGISALVDVSEHDAPAPPPEAVGAYKKKGEESTGVIAMVDLLIKDLDKELQEAGQAEKDAQADYEVAMKDAAEQRVTDTHTLADKETAKADTEGMLQTHKDGHVSATKELMATQHVIMQLHNECDWLLQYFDARKEARSAEIEALGKAKAVLSGADFSFLQLSAAKAPEDELAKEMTHDLEMNFNKIAPFGKEDTAKELQDHAAKTQDTLVDAVENAEVAEIKRAVFRALTRLRAATIKEFDTIARLETQAIDAYNDAHHYRAENPLTHLHEDEAPVETDKLKSFH
jgi:septal ring factor EnvC (AmiA/AmiB activator)